MPDKYSSFPEFYPHYLAEHSDPVCRRLHVGGSGLVLLTLASAMVLRSWLLLLLVPVVGYGFAWIGHFFFEHNRPTTFTQPLYSFLGDWAMFRDVVLRRIPW